MEYLTPEQIVAVLTAVKERSARSWAMTLLSYKHGLRPSECCGLRIADVDIRAGAVSIKRLKHSLDNRQELLGHRGKPILDEYLALRAWLKVRSDDPSPFLFTSQKSKRIDRTQWFREFQAICRDAGIKGDLAHPHVLRHSLATHMVEKHADVLEIKQRLGHKSIQLTMVYSHIGDRQADAAAKRVLTEIF
jgi:type 1 fimbriae regulatory protein FimB